MAKIKVKGTVFQKTISAVLTDIAQCISIEFSGAEVETFNSTTLDGGVGMTYSQTGFSEGGTCDVELYYDPALSAHQAITDEIAAPADCVWNVTFADSGTTDMGFTSAGVGFGISVQMGDGLKGSVSLKLTGLPTFPT